MARLYKEEVLWTKELGEKIGYGNLMEIASALWVLEFQKRELPVDGVLVPTGVSFINDESYKISVLKQRENYIRDCKEVLNDNDHTS